ncbi:MAG TPA: tetratricopeptide repeat protein [Oculatellaceae cyanobacterium]
MQNLLETAVNLRTQGKHEECRSILSDLLKQAPEDAYLNYQMAWVHDNLGLEEEAVPFYERALRNGLTGEDRKGAMLGLGSTYRCVGRHADSVKLLTDACHEYPNDRSLRVFLALGFYDSGQTGKAMSVLLEELITTTSDESIVKYKKALTYYANELSGEQKN